MNRAEGRSRCHARKDRGRRGRTRALLVVCAAALALLAGPHVHAQGSVPGSGDAPYGPIPGQAGELVDLGNGVPGLRLFGSQAGASQSLLLADAGLLGLARPELYAAFDGLVYAAGDDRPLLVLVTATADSLWNAEIHFSQGQHEVSAIPPRRLQLLEGSEDRVGPESPVVAVALLPARFSLRQPILVSWGGSSATITFRR